MLCTFFQKDVFAILDRSMHLETNCGSRIFLDRHVTENKKTCPTFFLLCWCIYRFWISIFQANECTTDDTGDAKRASRGNWMPGRWWQRLTAFNLFSFTFSACERVHMSAVVQARAFVRLCVRVCACVRVCVCVAGVEGCVCLQFNFERDRKTLKLPFFIHFQYFYRCQSSNAKMGRFSGDQDSLTVAFAWLDSRLMLSVTRCWWDSTEWQGSSYSSC